MEGHELHPSRDLNGTHWFDPDEVDRVIAERELGGSPGSRRWLDAQQQRRTEPLRGISNTEEGVLVDAIRDRLHIALISLTPRDLSRIPVELLDAVTDILDAVETNA